MYVQNFSTIVSREVGKFLLLLFHARHDIIDGKVQRIFKNIAQEAFWQL